MTFVNTAQKHKSVPSTLQTKFILFNVSAQNDLPTLISVASPNLTTLKSPLALNTFSVAFSADIDSWRPGEDRKLSSWRSLEAAAGDIGGEVVVFAVAMMCLNGSVDVDDGDVTTSSRRARHQ